MRRMCLALGLIVWIAWGFPGAGAAQMESDNYRIPTSVLSGGGGSSSSSSYQLQGTLGQPSPLMDPADPPYSDGFALYPGFWYTLIPACLYDLDDDGDVDGQDLAELAQGFGTDFNEADLVSFALEFGGNLCP